MKDSCVCVLFHSDQLCECVFINPSLENDLYEVCEKVAHFDPVYDRGLYELCAEVEYRIMYQRKGKLDSYYNADDIAKENKNCSFQLTDPENNISTEINEDSAIITREKRPRPEDEPMDNSRSRKCYRTHVKIFNHPLNSNENEETLGNQNESNKHKINFKN